MGNGVVYVAHFFAAFFLVNSIPHIVQGVSGNRFQTPFAKPPGVGESSSTINVLWGAFNLLAGGLLLRFFPVIDFGVNIDWVVLVTGGLFTGIVVGRHFERVRNNNL